MSARPSQRVRAFLQAEVPRWREEGILDARGAGLLSERYGLGGVEPRGLAVAALYVLAACLVGGGVVSLVAWHWDDLARWLRLTLLGVALVAAHVAGYRMWKVTYRQPRLGHAISLLGTILFGASIGLVAQIFQVSGRWYGAFGAWALGALVAGIVLPSLPAVCLASILTLFVWGPGYIGDHAPLGDLLAWLAGGAFLGLAFRWRSRVLLLLSTSGLAVVLAAAAANAARTLTWDTWKLPVTTLLAMAAASCAFAAWQRSGDRQELGGVAALLGRTAFYGLAYLASFEWICREFVAHPAAWCREWVTCALLPAVLATILIATTRRSSRPEAVALRVTAMVTLALALLFAVTAQVEEPPLFLSVLANLALLAVAGVWMAHGLASRQRAPFWEGLAVAALVAVSRFLEIESLLWLKGAGFIVSGVAVVAAALAFERRFQGRAEEVRHV